MATSSEAGERAADAAPRNVWLVAGTSVFEPYPCRCEFWRSEGCSPMWCPCAGRLDVWNFGARCCAWVNTPAVVARARRAYDAARGN